MTGRYCITSLLNSSEAIKLNLYKWNECGSYILGKVWINQRFSYLRRLAILIESFMNSVS